MAKLRDDVDIYADIIGAVPTAEAEQGKDAVRRNYYLTRALVHRVRSYGRRHGLSASTVVKLALEEFLEKRNA
ncbi:MAG: hypothetical protein HY675_02470 [Chloroflexi bacterium]|nr:hypothetical protein [Chloroflexota bacterium]